ncbi:MAG TPA: hypothetical protein PKV16_06335 [Caldisericia bacterium]|nr:hypothetical protein [Caldisericia bacterium]HPF49193.1 hypothetical protein [Caldisericia bacterium]HPI84128.1 hypothetical protein [Caldisericia bacterium]HPQ93385.1 hypothetical protein [Caldisericia bacterium]HRV75233.1 hypothetical protein [Caldisericia bacterium]
MPDKFKWILVLVAVLLAVAAYVVTSYFLSVWPFSKTVTTVGDKVSSILSSLGSDDGTIEGIDERTYEIASGELTIYGDFAITFPKDWIVFDVDHSGVLFALDLENPDTSISVATLPNEQLGFGYGTAAEIQTSLQKLFGDFYSDSSIEETEYLGKKCFLLSKSADDETSPGISSLTLFVPGDSTSYLASGRFPVASEDMETVESVLSSFLPVGE